MNNKSYSPRQFLLLGLILVIATGCSAETAAPDGDENPDPTTNSGTYSIVDTGQTLCYGNAASIVAPASGEAFFGQDAQYTSNSPSYQDNNDGTVTDLVTGLMWQQDPGAKMNLSEASALVGSFSLAGHDDWRLPTIKELYSLIRFDGTDPSGLIGNDTSGLIPFIDDVFTFAYGDPTANERIIDSQYLTSTTYVSYTMGRDETVFGVNFADGRIKGYPVTDPLTQTGKDFFAMFVRGGSNYGQNSFSDNGDSTITDQATGLMWMQYDSGHLDAGDNGGLNWADALSWGENLDHAGYSDWRLPTVKELQSIVDYSRSPATHGTAAIDPIFASSGITHEEGGSDFAFYWSGTTHANHVGLGSGAYVAFGTGYGYMEMPPNSGNYNFTDVHGAGCQRSDPKEGDPADYPYGHGPQGDVIRISNHVRLVRTVVETSSVETPASLSLVALQATPNPFNPMTTLSFVAPMAGQALIEIFDLRGQRHASLTKQVVAAGEQSFVWRGVSASGRALPSGVYLARLQLGRSDTMTKITLVR